MEWRSAPLYGPYGSGRTLRCLRVWLLSCLFTCETIFSECLRMNRCGKPCFSTDSQDSTQHREHYKINWCTTFIDLLVVILWQLLLPWLEWFLFATRCGCDKQFLTDTSEQVGRTRHLGSWTFLCLCWCVSLLWFTDPFCCFLWWKNRCNTGFLLECAV